MNIKELNHLDLRKLSEKILPLLKKVWHYRAVIVTVVVVLMYSFLVLRLNSLTAAEPADDQVTERLSTVKRLRVDQTAIDRIQKLQDNSSDVRALFEHARDNPFNE